MFSNWFDDPKRRQRDRRRVLHAMWSVGLSRVSVSQVALSNGVPEHQVQAALLYLEAKRLVTRLERTGLRALTVEGHRAAKTRNTKF